MIKLLFAIISRLSGAAGSVAGALVVPLVLLTVAEVVRRYLLDAPSAWGFELSTMLTGAIILLGLSYTLREEAHVRVDIWYRRRSTRARALIDGFGLLFLAVPGLLLLLTTLTGYLYEGVLSGEGTGQSAWNPPAWPMRAVYVVSVALLLAQTLAAIYDSVRRFRGRGS